MLKTALAATCVLVIVAVAYLTLSVVVLRPPRVNDPVWFAVASAVFIANGMTLAALRAVSSLRNAATLAGAALALLGGWMIQQTLASSHFEGYELLLGAMLVLQSLLTVAVFARRPSLA